MIIPIWFWIFTRSTLPVLNITHPIADDTILPSTLQQNPPQRNPQSFQPLPGPSTLQPSALRHQKAQNIHAIQKTIKQLQLHQHLKLERLKWKALFFIALQFQNDFVLLRYLLYSSLGATPSSVNSVTQQSISPTVNPTSTSPLLPSVDSSSVCRFIPDGTMGPLKLKAATSENAGFQFTSNAQTTTLQWFRI